MSKYTYGIGGILGAVVLAGTAHAVVLNPQGSGQVLIYPYYNVSGGNTTLVTLTNPTDRSKVVRLRWAEGENGRDTLTFHVYLGMYDSWTAGIFADAQGRANLVTDDDSCTFPPIARSTSLPQLPDGRRYARFAVADPPNPGSTDLARTREGFFEAIEVGSVRPSTPTYEAVNTSQRDCAVVEAAWTAPGGYWLADPKRDLANPTGGLSGYAAIVNVGAGTIFGTPALALEDFRVDPLDVPRGSSASVVLNQRLNVPNARPTLADALSDPATSTARAIVAVEGRLVSATYPASQAIDAVSAVLMAARLRGDFDTTPSVGATTSFALTYPTRRFYTDRALLSSSQPIAPFTELFDGREPLDRPAGLTFRLFDREAMILAASQPAEGCGFICPPLPDVRHPNTSVQLIAPGGTPDPLLATRLHGDIGYAFPGQAPLAQQGSGWIDLDLAREEYLDGSVALRPSLEGYRFLGLPVIGTRLINYINANVQAGTLANYSMAAAMTWSTRCAKADGTACAP